jgi:hypothetical protein
MFVDSSIVRNDCLYEDFIRDVCYKSYFDIKIRKGEYLIHQLKALEDGHRD